MKCKFYSKCPEVDAGYYCCEHNGFCVKKDELLELEKSSHKESNRMDIRDEIDEIVKKYKLQSHVFIGCNGEVHYTKFFGKEEHLMKMLASIRKEIKKYFADKEN